MAQYSGQELSGFAWANTNDAGANGPGWISFRDPYNDPPYYVVNVDSSGNLNGFAWANPVDSVSGQQNYGWLKFGGLSGFPTTGGTTPENAKIVGNRIVGWARFCSATLNALGTNLPGNCSTSSVHPNSGGWDGWVSFSGEVINSSGNNIGDYGVTIGAPNSQGQSPLSGFAWGGPISVGWIDLTGVFIGNPDTSHQTFEFYGNGQQANTFLSLNHGDNLLLSWTTVGMKPVKGCSASGTGPSWSGFKDSTDGSHVENPISVFNFGTVPVYYSFVLSCEPSDLSPVIAKTILIEVAPLGGVNPIDGAKVKLYVNGIDVDQGVQGQPNVTVPSGSNVLLKWSTNGVSPSYPNYSPTLPQSQIAKNCTASTDWSGQKVSNNNTAQYPFHNEPTLVVINTTSSPIIKTYTLTCNPPSGPSIVKTARVRVMPAGSTVSSVWISANPVAMNPAQGITTSVLNYGANNVSSCSPSSSGTGAPAGTVDWTSTTMTVSASNSVGGNKIVTPPVSQISDQTRYRITCNPSTGSAFPVGANFAEVAIGVLETPPTGPTIRIEAYKTGTTSKQIYPGEKVDIKWSTVNPADASLIMSNSCQANTIRLPSNINGVGSWSGMTISNMPGSSANHSTGTVSGGDILVYEFKSGTCKDINGNSVNVLKDFVNVIAPPAPSVNLNLSPSASCIEPGDSLALNLSSASVLPPQDNDFTSCSGTYSPAGIITGGTSFGWLNFDSTFFFNQLNTNGLTSYGPFIPTVVSGMTLNFQMTCSPTTGNDVTASTQVIVADDCSPVDPPDPSGSGNIKPIIREE